MGEFLIVEFDLTLAVGASSSEVYSDDSDS